MMHGQTVFRFKHTPLQSTQENCDLLDHMQVAEVGTRARQQNDRALAYRIKVFINAPRCEETNMHKLLKTKHKTE